MDVRKKKKSGSNSAEALPLPHSSFPIRIEGRPSVITGAYRFLRLRLLLAHFLQR